MRTVILASMLFLVLFGMLFLAALWRLDGDNLIGFPVPSSIENKGLMLLSAIAIARIAYAIHAIEHRPPRQLPSL